MKDYISEKIKNHNHQLNQKQQVERMIGEHNIEKEIEKEIKLLESELVSETALEKKKNIISKNRIT